MRRKKVSNGKSQRQFTKGAMNINRKNTAPVSMRGGIRL